jgi:16S rRNA (guanine1207-N2)-methyltransferase
LRHKTIPELSPSQLLEGVRRRIKPPVVVVLGSPRETADLVTQLGVPQVVCLQLDLYQADRLRDELKARRAVAEVVAKPDLWDLPAEFQTALYPVARGGERILKIDMIEQAFHILQPGGWFVVLSPYERESLFPPALKKVFGPVHSSTASSRTASGSGAVFWCRREGDRPRRRHELTFQVRVNDQTSLRFLSRPGTFSYGRFDDGARALTETMTINSGDRILDLGCGCGTNGVLAGRLAGPFGHVTFVDSNVRAATLAGHNARANGLGQFEGIASSTAEELPPASFDVALANPPYYAQASIAELFVERSRQLLKPSGRFYLVTKQPDVVGPMIEEAFGEFDFATRRGYTILSAVAKD